MKLLRLILLSLLLISGQAYATQAFDQQAGTNQTGAGSTTYTCSLTGVNAGATIVLTMVNRDNGDFPASATDTVNGAWPTPSIIQSAPAGSGGTASILYFLNSAAGSPTITVTLNRVAQSSVIVNCIEYTATGTVSLDDFVETQENLATTSHSNGALDISAAGVLVFACGLGGGDTTAYSASSSPTTYTKLSDGGGFRMFSQYHISTGALSGQTATWSSGGDSIDTVCVGASFVEASASSPVPKILQQH